MEARKILTTVKKLSAKFNVFHLRPYLLRPGVDVYWSLQVKTCGMHDKPRFDLHVQNRDHVKPFGKLISFYFKLSILRGILLNLVDDHVKHQLNTVVLRQDRVRLLLKLPRRRAFKL